MSLAIGWKKGGCGVKKLKELENLVLISQVGISMVTPILLMTFLGNVLDRYLGAHGIVLIVFILLGVGAGFYALFQLGKKK